MIYIYRGNPAASPPPDGTSATTVRQTTRDGAMVTIGAKMFSSSDVGFVTRGDQMRYVGRKSNGRFGDTHRYQPSHGTTINVSIDGAQFEETIFSNLDQYVKDQVADLVNRRYLIVEDDGVPLTAEAVRVF